MNKAPVNRIIPFSNVDGPGCRTSIFFQGCSFSCLYCHNPETIHLCRHCGVCVASCKAGALSVKGGKVEWNPDRCVLCDTCLKVCPHSASPRIRWITVDDVMQELTRTFPYIEGITVSGGDCTLYPDFLKALFAEVRKHGKTCLIDGNGAFDFSRDPDLLAVTDGVMLDVKATDPAWSLRLTGQDGTMVKQSLRFLLAAGKLTEVRTVIFPDRDTENEDTVRWTAQQIGSACPYKIIRYRPYGVSEKNQALIGDGETEAAYAERFAALARQLGASGAYVV